MVKDFVFFVKKAPERAGVGHESVKRELIFMMCRRVGWLPYEGSKSHGEGWRKLVSQNSQKAPRLILFRSSGAQKRLNFKVGGRRQFVVA